MLLKSYFTILKRFVVVLTFLPILFLDIFKYKFLFKKNSKISYIVLLNLYFLFGKIALNWINFFLSNKKEIYNYNNIISSNLYPLKFKRKKIYKDLVSKGLSIQKKILDSKFCDSLIKQIKNTPGYWQTEGKILLRNSYVDEKKNKATIFRYSPNELIKNLNIQDLVTNIDILKIAESYLNSLPIIDYVESWWSFPSKKKDHYAAQEWHYDMDRTKWIKVFFFLKDVNLNNGPHVFLKYSHEQKMLPIKLRLKGYIRLNDLEISNNFNLKNIKLVTGKKGDILFEDTIGLHKGERVKSENRLILQFQYSSSLFGSKTNKINTPIKISNNFKNIRSIYPKIFGNFT